MILEPMLFPLRRTSAGVSRVLGIHSFGAMLRCKINVFISMLMMAVDIVRFTGWSMILGFTLMSLNVNLFFIHGNAP
ncbi:hypothetical protein LINPERPRIM_LOCUS26308 [Linum perenne]